MELRNMPKYKIVYTTSDNPRMISDLQDSVESALNYTNSNNIIVIFTPPLDYEIIDKFKSMCNVIVRKENYTKPFKIHPQNPDNIEPPRYFGDKLLVSTIDYKNVLFLDCDTYVYNDPSVLFDDDFDFGGVAIDTPKKDNVPWQVNRNILQLTKNVYNIKDECHIWNAGHLVFKNHTHNRIGKVWLRYFNDKLPLRRIFSIKNTDDQMTLTPTLAEFPELKIKYFDYDLIFKVGWYIDKWNNYKFPDTVCIFHGDRLKKHIEYGRNERRI